MGGFDLILDRTVYAAVFASVVLDPTPHTRWFGSHISEYRITIVWADGRNWKLNFFKEWHVCSVRRNMPWLAPWWLWLQV